MASKLKAMYPITLYNDGKSDRERNVINVNQERLNENFRNLSEAIIELFTSGEHTLDYLSARVSKDEASWTAIGQQVEQNTAAILVLPTSITQSITDVITEYVAHNGEVQTDDPVLTTAIASLVQQSSDKLTVSFTTTTNAINNSVQSQDERLSAIESWVKIVAANVGAGTNAGVIIGSSDSVSSFKAEASCIFFYSGDDSRAKWANALAGLDSDGNFIASRAHIESLLLGNMFDVDVVEDNGVEFLHITGRS